MARLQHEDIIRRLSLAGLVETSYPLLANPSHAAQSSVFGLSHGDTDIPIVVVKQVRKAEHYQDEKERLESVRLSSRSPRLRLALSLSARRCVLSFSVLRMSECCF